MKRSLSQNSKTNRKPPSLIKSSRHLNQEPKKKLSEKRQFTKIINEQDFFNQIQKIGFEVINSQEINRIESQQQQSPQFGKRSKAFSFRQQNQERISPIECLHKQISNPEQVLHENSKKLKKLLGQLSNIKLQNKIIKNAQENLISKLKQSFNILSCKFSEISNVNDKLSQQNKCLKQKLSIFENEKEKSTTKVNNQQHDKITISKMTEQINILKENLKKANENIKGKNIKIQEVKVRGQIMNKKLQETLKALNKKDIIIQQLKEKIKNNQLIQQQIKKYFDKVKQQLNSTTNSDQNSSKANNQSSIPNYSTCGTETDQFQIDLQLRKNQSYFQSKELSLSIINNKTTNSKQTDILRMNSYNTLRQNKILPSISKNHQIRVNTLTQNQSSKTKQLENIDHRLCKLLSNISEQINLLKRQSNKY